MSWDVYLRGYWIDRVWFVDQYTAEEVRKSLINHDGYNSEITVRKGK